MKTVLLVCITAVFILQAIQALDPVTTTALIKEGLKLSAPFTETSSKRLHNEIFGSGRAARSSDVIIFNKSSRDFRLTVSTCKWGGFSSDMFPEHWVHKHTSIVYGIESNGFLAGVDCKIEYKSRDGQWFAISVDNPYFGHNVIGENSSNGIDVLSTLGQGNNNQVRFVIED